MQSLVLPPSSYIPTEFGHPRFNQAQERLSFSLPRSTNARRYTPRDLPPPRSMSGPVPAEDSLEASGNARRSGHPELFQPVSTATITVSTATPVGISGSQLPAGLAAVSEPVVQRMVSAPGEDVIRQQLSLSDAFPSTRLPPSMGAPALSQTSVTPYAQPSFGSSPPETSSRPLPQKPTRRTKAHVASACVNCKKKHLGCDPARPCRRCVLSGKEVSATCVDVTHKKRGRPPLKAEEASLRTYAAHMDRATAGEHHSSQSRRTHMHRATSSREIRPMTDLQMIGGQTGAMGMRVSSGHPHRWSASMYPHALDPAMTMQRSIGHRRFSSSGSAQSMTAASPPNYVPMPAGYNPALGVSRMPTGAARPLSSYTHQGLIPATTPPHYQQPFIPLSPYSETTRMANRMPIGEMPMARDPREGYIESPVRLPPIYAPTMGTPAQVSQSHRLSSDSYSALWSPPTREDFLHQEHRQHMPPLGFIEPVSPNSQMRPGGSDPGNVDPAIRQLGSVAPTTEGHSLQLSPPQAQPDQATAEAHPQDSRPAKRRKMALDDMVND
ncbi:putative C6 transcription factor [Aspergillus homomorphus CBS 101889]|uniref:Transcription activator of gluconeogenesis acuK n=1 Tax=Aspergillus homomorphus (strain CBS 101889) TaxID=1450537 RepID=A0A395ICX6_ASPHC|nr:C6 transcription factor [Aspergillus homomorphus CBS 101889]RAL17023.1 C6 transcription factor [Aspergillus homomorphus CBS 101889]